MEANTTTPDATCPSERPGIKTTEFWLGAGMMMLAAWLISKGKDELGAALAGIAGTVYTGFRGLVKSKLAQAGALLFVLVLAPGCATPGYVKASEVLDQVRITVARDKAAILADKSPRYAGAFGEQKRQSDVRGDEILLGTIEEAAAAGDEQATKDAATTRK